ncbi:MAG: serine protein kinase [Deltaproteobacteria bacterium]|nr:serine protein kinase [Deltaproteobacteria bacterium]
MERMLEKLAAFHNRSEYVELNWAGSLEEYLGLVRERPEVVRSAYQRLYDMIVSHGTTEYMDSKKKVIRYNFFLDETNGGRDAIYGLDVPIMRIMSVFKAAAEGYGPQRRIILLHGPVGSSKSTIVRLLKRGLESYTRSPEGAIYTFGWVLPGRDGNDELQLCPMHEEPLHLFPLEWRQQALSELGLQHDAAREHLFHDLCPSCRYQFQTLMEKHQGDWMKVMQQVRVKRFIFSEQDRVGIGTFQPKDEKNQDSTELTGDINYRKIAEYGTDSDPRAFNFDGEFCVANRGMIEFIEILKLDVAFLYDLLGATQEHKIKPKKFPQTDVDEVIIGHTNEAEYKKLLANEYMEALRDRTIKFDIPYVTRVSDEQRIYAKEFGPDKVKQIHVAPHTIEVAAMWAVLTRMTQPKKHNLTLVQKMKLYDGKVLPGFTQDTVRELRKEADREAMEGISPRYVQDRMSHCLVANKGAGNVNPFIIMNELAAGLRHHSLITNEEQRGRYSELLTHVKEEYDDIVKNEVQRAISADEEAISRLCANYLENVKAYLQKEKVKNRFTGREEEPDERLMRSIEEKIDISESRKDDFRREIMNYIGALALEGRHFDFRTNARLYQALEAKLFEDSKDTIRLSSLVSDVVDRETQEKIDIVKSRLIKYFGYNEESATDVLTYVASIFARGDVKEKR